jgi:hypothetical protein
MEEMGTMLRDKGVTIDNRLQEKIKELEVVFAHREFDHIPTIFWAEARGKRMLDEIRSKGKGEKRTNERSRNFTFCKRCEGIIWRPWGSEDPDCPDCGPCDSDTYGLITDEILARSLENLDCSNPRKRLRSN